MRHDDAVRVLNDLSAVAAHEGYALGYEVHHDGQEPEAKDRGQAEMRSQWHERLTRHHARGLKGAKTDRDAMPDGSDHVLLEVLLPGTTARVVQLIEMDVLLGNSSAKNLSLLKRMCSECKSRA